MDDKSRAIAAIGLLSELESFDIFQTPPSNINRVIDIYLDKTKRNHWILLESIVIFDEILYDSYAFTRWKMSKAGAERLEALKPHGLTPRQWSVEIYKRVAENLKQNRRMIEKMGLQKEMEEIPIAPGLELSAYYDGDEKRYHDDLFASEVMQYSFAESQSDDVARAYFYAELCRDLDISMLPRPTNHLNLLDTFSKSYSRCAHSVVQNTLADFDALMRPAEISVLMPPLAQKILSLSAKNRRSLLDTAGDLRHSKEAKAYRRHIAQLDLEIRNSGLKPGKLKALLRDLEVISKKWISDESTNEGVKYRTRSLRVQFLPAAAGLLKYLTGGDFGQIAQVVSFSNVIAQALFGSSIDIPIPTVWREGNYVSFVADWYNRSADDQI